MRTRAAVVEVTTVARVLFQILKSRNTELSLGYSVFLIMGLFKKFGCVRCLIRSGMTAQENERL
jgi:hypothetical protein